ncbi:MAG: FAD binding domain-containing protein [Alphaproteobacteria bacterium]|nr:FAD binding domain-containing protein [Alphaproteobacteria bacterium]
MGSYLRPQSIKDALDALATGPRVLLAGGTDYYPARVGLPLDDDILDITAIPDLTGITDAGDHWRIGAMARWSDLNRIELPPAFDGLKAAARRIGGAQVQNAATICGNVCNASPAADGVPNLLVLDAAVELSSTGSTRTLPVGDFITGNRATGRRTDELVTALLIPKTPDGAHGDFLKLGARSYLVISIAMVAVLLAPATDGTVAEARIAVGACSPVAQRLPALEAALRGCPLDTGLGRIPDPSHLAPLSPINDVRATAGYRLDAALTLLCRALRELGEGMA